MNSCTSNYILRTVFPHLGCWLIPPVTANPGQIPVAVVMEILKFGLSAIRKLRSPGILPLSDTWRLVNAVRKVKFTLLQ